MAIDYNHYHLPRPDYFKGIILHMMPEHSQNMLIFAGSWAIERLYGYGRIIYPILILGPLMSKFSQNPTINFTDINHIVFCLRPKNANDTITLSTPWRTGHRLPLSQIIALMRCSGVSLICQTKGTLDPKKSGVKNVMAWKYSTTSRRSFMHE